MNATTVPDLRLAAHQEPAADREDADDAELIEEVHQKRHAEFAPIDLHVQPIDVADAAPIGLLALAPLRRFAVSTMSTASPRTVLIRSAVRRLIAPCRTGNEEDLRDEQRERDSAIHGSMKSM